MKNLLIVDLEATCYERGQEPPDFFSEIIEIGAVLLDTSTRQPGSEYQAFVKPVLFPTLSTFCTHLTTIQQAEVDAGLPLDVALQRLGRLYDPHHTVFASWGFYDQRQIERVCQRFAIPYPFAPDHISLKHSHAKFYTLEHPLGMDAALTYHGMPLAGTHHRGLDDARNITALAVRMLEDGWSHRRLAP
jgi:inhibitor of KinA sporulation pathway (predicted exonuclease)